MYYYSHHIGDFDLATRHLTRIERSIYRDLIEVYYDTEKQLTLDTQLLCRRILARSTDEVTAVEQVLKEFFLKSPTGWYHGRCEKEIELYQKSTSQKAMAGRASAAAKEARKQQAINGVSTAVEHANNGTSTNHKPLTNNHKPEIKTDTPPAATAAPKYSFKQDLLDSGVDAQIAVDWLAVRKAKKASNTETAMKAIKREAEKAGLSLAQAVMIACERDWKGFKAEWVLPESGKIPGKAAPWWSSDALILAEGEKMGMRPNAGEYMPAFKGRVQAALDNGGKPPSQPRSNVTTFSDDGAEKVGRPERGAIAAMLKSSEKG